MSIVDDFKSINERLGQIRPEAPSAPAAAAEPDCETCEGSGYECYGLGFNDPHFRECPTCGNPEGLPCP